MRLNRSEIIPEGEPVVLHIICTAVRQLLIFRNGTEHDQSALNRKLFIEEVLLKLCAAWCASLISFNISDHQVNLHIGFDPRAIDALSDREVVEIACDLDVKSKKRGKFSPAQRERWIKTELSSATKVKRWREIFSSVSEFMRYFKEAISKEFNRLDNTKGALWSGRFKAVRIEDERGQMAVMQYVDLTGVRVDSAPSLQESIHSSIYYRLLDVASLPPSQQAHAHRVQSRLCALPEVFNSFGWNTMGPSLAEYVEMLIVEGGRVLVGESKLSEEPEQLMARYGLRLGWTGKEGLQAFEQCSNVIGSPESIARAGRKLNRCWDDLAEAVTKIFT